MNPRTTVITLTANRPDYLASAIASIEAQTDSDYEHLVYDNGSSDPRVIEVLRAAKARNPGKFFFAASGGPPVDLVGVHWNVMLGFARGKYITILDDDNCKRHDFIERTLMPMEADATIDAVSCGWSPMDGDGIKSGEDRHKNVGTTLKRLFRDNTIDSNALTFRRTVLDKIGHFDPILTTNEDWHFMIRLVRSCRVIHLEDVLLDYREHGTSRSKRALELGAHANWTRILTELYSTDEIRSQLRGA